MMKVASLLFAVAVSLLVAGCQQPTTSTPPPADISSAPAGSTDKFSKAFSGLSSVSPSGQRLPAGVTIEGSYSDSSAIDATLVFTNYTPDGNVTILNGRINVKASVTDSLSVIHETGSLAISGTGEVSGSVSFNLTITVTTINQTSKVTVAGTCTIDGVAYSVKTSY